MHFTLISCVTRALKCRELSRSQADKIGRYGKCRKSHVCFYCFYVAAVRASDSLWAYLGTPMIFSVKWHQVLSLTTISVLFNWTYGLGAHEYTHQAKLTLPKQDDTQDELLLPTPKLTNLLNPMTPAEEEAAFNNSNPYVLLRRYFDDGS